MLNVHLEGDPLERFRSGSHSLSDQFCSSLASLHSFLTPEQKPLLPDSDRISTFTIEFSASKIIESILHQSIGFITSPHLLPFTDSLRQHLTAVLSSIDVDNWRFLIDGPLHSGRSTLLSFISIEAIQKLTTSSQLSRVFVFPINWELAVQKLTDFTSLYEYLITQVVFQLSWQCPRLFPVTPALLNWFLSIPSKSSVPSLPFNITGMPLFPIASVEVVAKQIATSVKRASQIELANMVATLPSTLAGCFGFDRFLYIYDHLDLIDRRLDNDGSVMNAILVHIANHLAFVSAKLAIGANRFRADRFEPVATERIVVPPEKVRTIQLQFPTLPLTIESCRGCAAFVARFLRIVEVLEMTERQTAESDRKRGCYSIATDTRQKMACVETIQLCRDLLPFDVNGLDEQVLEEMTSNPRFAVSLKRKGRK